MDTEKLLNEAEFYNDSFKKEYIRLYGRDDDHIIALISKFKIFKPLEAETGCDLYDFSLQRIVECYKCINTTSLSFLINYNSEFDRYSRYAMEQNLIKDGMNHYAEVTADTLNMCLNQVIKDAKFITREEILNKWMPDLDNAADKFLVLACYEGIRGRFCQELLMANVRDINFTDHTMKLCSGRTIKISKQLEEYAIDSANEDTYAAVNNKEKQVHVNGAPGQIIKFPYERDSNGDKGKAQRIFRRLKNILQALGQPPTIKIKNLAESGRIRMINDESRRLGISPEEYVRKYGDELYNQYGFKPSSIPAFMLENDKYFRKDF